MSNVKGHIPLAMHKDMFVDRLRVHMPDAGDVFIDEQYKLMRGGNRDVRVHDCSIIAVDEWKYDNKRTEDSSIKNEESNMFDDSIADAQTDLEQIINLKNTVDAMFLEMRDAMPMIRWDKRAAICREIISKVQEFKDGDE